MALNSLNTADVETGSLTLYYQRPGTAVLGLCADRSLMPKGHSVTAVAGKHFGILALRLLNLHRELSKKWTVSPISQFVADEVLELVQVYKKDKAKLRSLGLMDLFR